MADPILEMTGIRREPDGSIAYVVPMVDEPGWITPLPIVEAVVHGPAMHVQIRAGGLVDSGATISSLPVECAHRLGVLLEDEVSEIHVIGEGPDRTIPARRGAVNVIVAGREVQVRALFGPCEHLILGRDWFEAFGRVEFDLRGREVILRPHPEG